MSIFSIVHLKARYIGRIPHQLLRKFGCSHLFGSSLMFQKIHLSTCSLIFCCQSTFIFQQSIQTSCSQCFKYLVLFSYANNYFTFLFVQLPFRRMNHNELAIWQLKFGLRDPFLESTKDTSLFPWEKSEKSPPPHTQRNGDTFYVVWSIIAAKYNNQLPMQFLSNLVSRVNVS